MLETVQRAELRDPINEQPTITDKTPPAVCSIASGAARSVDGKVESGYELQVAPDLSSGWVW